LKTLSKLQELAAENRRLEVNRTRDIDELKAEFKALFDQIQNGINGKDIMNRALLQLSAAAEKGIEYTAEQAFLDYLRFNVMDDRHIAIRPAHAETFSWIFEGSAASTNESRPSIKFIKWLQ
jgi:hypothetical protein